MVLLCCPGWFQNLWAQVILLSQPNKELSYRQVILEGKEGGGLKNNNIISA